MLYNMIFNTNDKTLSYYECEGGMWEKNVVLNVQKVGLHVRYNPKVFKNHKVMSSTMDTWVHCFCR